MRKAHSLPNTHQASLTHWLRAVLLAILIGLLLAGCVTGDSNDNSSDEEEDKLSGEEKIDLLDTQAKRYAATLRNEADWLWDNMNHARTNPVPDAGRCVPKDFNHEPVNLRQDTLEQDVPGTKLAQRLDYVRELLQQASDNWFAFCNNQSSAQNTINFMSSRLNPAYDSLDSVDQTLELRAQSAK
ncbi:MAG: hypothetical protein JW966_02570 [Anaerolineae bacterium]|nr:hypothetical protein [Anaerolineae bacterium]